MKEMLKRTILFALALVGLMGCNDDMATDGLPSQEGYLTFSVATTDDVEMVTTRAVESKTPIATAAGEGYIAPMVSDFSIEVRTDKDEDGKADTGDDAKQLIYSGKLSSWNVATKLKQGYYVVTASYGSNAIGFNSPVFKGEPVQFTIVGGETTAVKIDAELGNAIVRIEFTDMFKKYYSFDKLTLKQGESTIDFSPTETRGAFVEATAFTLEGTFTAQSGAEKSFRKVYQARMTTCHRIKFDASNIGGNTIDIKFDDEPSETIKFDAELNEQPSGN
ncbi:MAG: DUF4493 domain-containing protein [Alistipes sp.]|nr:DUF4493 domain-containing protein [Alistipes sp.]